MKTALISAFGGSDAINIGDVCLRELHSTEVAVRVETAGLNPLDLQIIRGGMQQVFPVAFPYTPGTDFSGVVEAVGAQVTAVKLGDRIAGRTAPSAGGAFAQHLIIAAAAVCVIPGEMSFEQAAALPTTFGTAWQALFDVGHLRRGQRVLIHGGAGGVGSMAVQLAHHAGAHVIATASAHNRERVRSLGAAEVLDRRTQDFTQVAGVDLVLDTIGGETLERSWHVLRPGGRIASLVEFGIQPRDGHPGEFVFFADAAPFLHEAMRMFQGGQLQIIIDSIFPLEEARAALEKLAAAPQRGKVLLRTRAADVGG